MANYLLIVIYSTFVSIGMPMSIIGVAWPAMQRDFNVPYSYAGLISMAMTAGTIIMSVLSIKLIRRFGTGKIMLFSVITMALSLLGFCFIQSFFGTMVLAGVLGLGMGTIDCGINAYMAQHYKSRHMNWLHCFWGIGAMLGPIIMASYLSVQGQWRNGFLIIALIQFVLALVLFFTLPKWDGDAVLLPGANPMGTGSGKSSKSVFSPLKIRGVYLTLMACLFYCGIENTFGLWGNSFFIQANGTDVSIAAAWVSLFFGSIAAGRLVAGFITMKFGDKVLIRTGGLSALIGSLILIIPIPVASVIGIILLGVGCAPIYPGLIHQTPSIFGKENAQATVSLQVGVAYIGSTFVPPLFGFIATGTTMHILPFFMMVFFFIILVSSERLNKIVYKK